MSKEDVANRLRQSLEILYHGVCPVDKHSLCKGYCNAQVCEKCWFEHFDSIGLRIEVDGKIERLV